MAAPPNLETTAVRKRPFTGEESTGIRHLYRRYRWILIRLGLGVLTLFVVSLVIFIVTMVLPGDAAQVILGRTGTPERVEVMREKLGLNQPVVMQYLQWIGGIFQGSFGESLISGRSVIEMLSPRIVNSVTLLAFTTIIGFPIAILLGFLAAVKPRGFVDGVVNLASIIISALPEFVVGILLIMLLAAGTIQLLPAVSLIPAGDSPLAHPEVLVLPVLTLVLVIIPYLSRQTRASIHEALASEAVVMAELKGMSRRIVLMRHAFRSSLAPVIQAGALTLAFLLGGTVVIEYVFQYPGLGLSLIQAVDSRDVPVIQAAVMILAFGYVLFNLLADILTVFLTPKLRTE